MIELTLTMMVIGFWAGLVVGLIALAIFIILGLTGRWYR